MFRVSYCFILVFVAIALISKLAVTVRTNMYHHTGFLLCLVFACWFAYNMVYEFADKIAHTSKTLSVLSRTVTGYIGYAEALMYAGCAWAIHYLPSKKTY